MDPCPFVRVLVGNLALKMPAAPGAAGAAGAGVHPTTAPCYCRIRLGKLPYQTATAPLLPPAEDAPASCTGAFAAAFHLSKADVDRAAAASARPALSFAPRRRAQARLKVAVYAGRRRGGACAGMGGAAASAGRLLGKVVLPLDLGALDRPVVLHAGWVPVGKRKAMLNLAVRADPDPRFVFQFDGEPERGPQVMQVRGGMRQPMFTCRFTSRSASTDLRSRSTRSDPGYHHHHSASRSGSSRSWLGGRSVAAGSGERKGWSVTVHDLSGSPVALASMVTPFVPCAGSHRVGRSNPGAWLLLRPADGTWTPWGRLECWRERGGPGGGGDLLGYRFDLLPDHTAAGNSTGVCVAESSVPVSRGGRFAIDLTAAQPFGRTGSPGRSGSDLGGLWPFGTFRGFVMAADVQGEGRRARRPAVVEVGVAHVGCAEDAAAFVALAAAVDLSMDASRPFSRKLRRTCSGDPPIW